MNAPPTGRLPARQCTEPRPPLAPCREMVRCPAIQSVLPSGRGWFRPCSRHRTAGREIPKHPPPPAEPQRIAAHPPARAGSALAIQTQSMPRWGQTGGEAPQPRTDSTTKTWKSATRGRDATCCVRIDPLWRNANKPNDSGEPGRAALTVPESESPHSVRAGAAHAWHPPSGPLKVAASSAVRAGNRRS